MAFDLVAAYAQADTPFYVTGQSASTLTESPQQITLRFSSGAKIDPSTLSAITVMRAGGDNVVGNGNDVNVTPAGGVGIVTVDDFPNQNQVVLRFAENLPDDLYRITIGGGLKTVAGGPSAPADSFRGGNAFSLNVRLDLGALVVAVVPQPIGRVGSTPTLQQSLDTVDVYFNANDRLQDDSARNPRNYRLVETDPVSGADVAVQIPQSVAYDPASGRARLTFAAALGNKLYRLQVGGSDDDNGTIAKAVVVGSIFQQSVPATPAYTTHSFLGDGSADVNDVDLYKFRVAAAGTLTVRATPAPGFTPVLRLFNATGEEITTGIDTSQPNALTYTATAADTFHVGISSVGNAGYNPITGVPATGTVGTTRGSYRLEILSSVQVPVDDPGQTNTNSSFTTATGLGTLGLAGQAFNAAIDVLPTIPTPVFPLGFPSNPGTIDEPGHREIQLPLETHAMPAGSVKSAGPTPVQPYFFPDVYGVDGQGKPLRNVITENQKQRAREIFELYSRATGVRFVENLTGGLAVVTGDIRAVDPNLPVPGGPAGICGVNIVVMNSGLDWGKSEYGSQWQSVAMHEIGHFLGLGHSYDLRSNMGAEDPTVLPGDYDLQHLSVVKPALGTDIDVYSFQIETDGRLSAETVVARPGQAAISQLDTVLTLYRQDPATGMRELVARNDDYYARDSFLGMELRAAAPSTAKYTYYLAVTSTGNTAFDPEVQNSGANGRSDGAYRLQLGFTPAGEVSNTIVDATGTPIDGDRDGLAGGAFNFWFRSSTASNTVYVDKAAAGRNASLVANSTAATGIDVTGLAVGMLVTGTGIQANTTITAIGSGSVTLSRAALATNSAASLKFGNGTLAFPFVEIDHAVAAVTANTTIIRIVGNATGAAAMPYLVGTTLSDPPQPLADGASFVVPAGVTVMIDEGAVLKLRGAVIDVGSSSQLVSRAGAALQVLGTPGNRVKFTSYHDDSLGGDSDGVGTSAAGGQWGGILFRQDSDSASKRVFLNSVSQADISYGGGRVTINSKEQSIAPLHLETSRPTIAFNDVRNSAGAAISADPNSFEESNGRTGPSIRGNVVRDNSLNGLLVRIRTEFGQPIDRLTVPARFASPDITYIVPENLFIAGGVGGYQTRVLQKTGNLTVGNNIVTGLADITGLQVGMPVFGPGVPGGATIRSIDAPNRSISLIAPAPAVQSGRGVTLNFNAGIQKTGDLTVGSNTVTFLSDVDGLQVGMPVSGPGVPGGATIGSIDAQNLSITLVAAAPAAQSGADVALSFDTGIIEARASGRLAVDPGVVVKLQGSRIELERGNAQLYAEGTPQKRVILTSTRDNRFGAGGTFVAVGTTANAPAAGNWGGIVINDAAAASIDNAVISFGGGQTPVEGGFASFNTLSVDQGSLRLANSRFENNATGIYVLGAQPVIVSNDFRNNAGDLISVDANSLNSFDVPDPGRSTGPVGRYAEYDGNRGPLVRGNRVTAGGVTGMIIRGDEITCESVWDDTDIVHVVRNEIIVSNFHVMTGLRLMSSPTASLVVKLRGPNAGLTATGEPADIDDRVGGTVQVIGQPGYPVILTSLADDKVGASLDQVGRTVTDTNGDGSATSPVAGDWRGLRFLPFSNDRNVAVLRETEPAVSGGLEANALTETAQTLGVLAPNESGGDDNRRLGFEVHGAIARDASSDVDVYSFSGYVGSEVWIDIDYTSSSLDSMVELLNEAGTVLARSADVQTDHPFPGSPNPGLSAQTLGGALPFLKNSVLGPDLLSPNPRDAGMRVVLPGATAGALTNYYIRVRSQPRTSPTASLSDYQAQLRDADPIQPGDQVDRGATSGGYQLRVRLRQLDEKPGSTVRHADIRYPVVGVDVQGLPQRSPLTGDVGENPTDTTNASTANPLPASQYVGNLLASDLNTISIAGSILSEGDVDWYAFDLNYEQIQAIGGVNGGLKTFATVFDIDYADGFRGDLTLAVFDSAGGLIFVGRDSNIADDQPLSGQPVFAGGSRGSAGVLDPFIGPVHLPAGLPGGTQRYYVAVASNERLPAVLDMTFKSAATNTLIRLEPTNSSTRLVEDHIGFIGYHSGEKFTGSDASDYSFVAPSGGPLFDLPNLQQQVATPSIDGIARYVAWQPQKGETAELPAAILADDLAMRSDGRLYTYTGVPNGVNTAGRVEWISIRTSQTTPLGNDNIPNFPKNVLPTPLTDNLASSTTTTTVATVTTFVLDAQGTQTGTVELATVRGTLQYTTTLPGSTLPSTGTWTFTSNGAGQLSFTPVGDIPALMPLPSPTGCSVNAQGTLSVRWVDNGSGATVFVSGLSMTDVEYTFNPEIPRESVTTDNVDALAWHRAPGKAANFDELYYSVRDVDPLTTDPVTKLQRETGVSRLYRGRITTGDATDTTENGTDPEGRIGLVIQTAAGNQLGLTTGMVFIGQTLYGVDNRGHLFTIDRETAVATVIGRVRVGGQPANLQGLANGPQNLSGGPNATPGYFADKLFAIDADGFLFCIDPAATPTTPGVIDLLPVLPDPTTGQNDATSLYIGAVDPTTGARVLTGAITGFAFSPIDVPLWRATNTRGGEAGHGVTLAPDNTRDGRFTNAGTLPPESQGGTSIYYGLDGSGGTANDGTALGHLGVVSQTWLSDLISELGSSVADLPAPGVRPVTLRLCGTAAGSSTVFVPTTRDLVVGMLASGPGIPAETFITSIDSATGITLSRNATSGSFDATLTFQASNGITTLPFSLAGYTESDKPTLYFNYRIDAGAGSTTVRLRADGGAWVTIAANTHDRSSLDLANKILPNFPSVSSTIGQQTNQLVQELFEGTGWRQARIDLGQFHGVSSIELQFDFTPITVNGACGGVYFDDIIVGFAERGEMVTGQAAANTGFFDLNTPTSFTTPQQNLQGAYQLEIRRGMEFGFLTSPISEAVQILGDPGNFSAPNNVLDTNVSRIRGTLHPAATFPFAGFGGVTPGQNLRGDDNTPRGQGQFIIEGNVVSDAGQFGIRVDASARDAETGASTQGAVKTTSVPNTARLVPGVVIVNNVVANTRGNAAILFSGDPNSGTGALASVPYGRIVNNTIYGGVTGVQVTENAAPTLLNNVFSNLTTGVSVDPSSSGTVIGFSAFHATPGGRLGTDQIVLPTDPFVNAGRGNFYPAAKSLVIDTALDVLQDRDAFTAVTQPLGIPVSPIIAPGRDMYGQRRADDPGQETPTGLGSEVFKDLGAIDRVDFVQPSAAIAVPLDGVAADKDTAPNRVRLLKADARGIAKFELQLGDVGVGLDKATVVPEAFQVRLNGTLLAVGTDYTFNYLESSNRVVFEAAAIFPMGSYVISVVQAPVNGVPTNVVTDLAGNQLRPNQTDGTTVFTIELADAPTPPSGLVGLPDDGRVQLSWTASSSGASPLLRYEVQRSTNSSFAGATQINVPGTDVTLTDTGVVNGTQYWFRVRAVNDIGESDWSNDIGPIVPLPVPTFALAQDTGTSSTDGITSNPLVNVVIQVGSTWEYSVNGGTNWTTGSGTSFSLPTNATYPAGTIQVRQLVGDSRSGARTNLAAITVDTIAPVAAPLTAVIDDAPLTTGPVADGGTTNDAVLVLSGTTEAGTLVEVFDRTTKLGNAVVVGTTWTFTTGTLADGTTYVFKTRPTDLAGNVGPDSATHTVTIDTTPPSTPIITAVTDDVAPVIGPVANDGFTNDTVLVLSGTTAAGTTVEIFNGATKLGDATVVSTNWTFTTSTLVNGTTYVFTARAADSAGNTASSASHTVTIDTTPPAAPVITGALDDQPLVTGNVANGGTSNDPTLVLSGTTAAGTTVEIFNGATKLGDANVVGTTWTYTTASLANGTTYAFTAKATDAAGNVGPSSATYSVTIDTAPPAAPVIVSVMDNVMPVTGTVANDGFTNDTVLVLSGTTAAGTTVEIFNGATKLGDATVVSTNWTYTTSTLVNGTTYVFTARAADSAGNTASSASHTVTIDTTPPAAPVITGALDDQPLVTGNVPSGSTSNDPTLVISGTTAVGTTVEIFNGATKLGNATVVGTTWTYTTASLANGTTYAFTAKATDAAGNVSPDSAPPYSVTIDTTPPATPTFALTNDTGSSNIDWVTNDGTISVGSLEPGGRWEYSTNGGTTWTAGAANSFLLPAGLYAAGRVRVRQIDLAGNIGLEQSNAVAINVDTTAPAALSLALAADTGASDSDGVTNDGRVVVSGIELGATWDFSIDGGSTWTQGSSTTFTLPVGLYAAGRVFVRQKDVAGNQGPDSGNTLPIEVDSSAAAPQFALTSDTGVNTADQVTRIGSVTVSAVEARGFWRYSTDGGTLWSGWQPAATTAFTLPEGTYDAGRIRIQQMDLAGNQSVSTSNASPVVIDTTIPVAPALRLLNDTGVSTTDGRTNDGRLVLSDLEPNGGWQISTNGGTTWTPRTPNTLTVHTLAEGTYPIGSVVVRQLDLAGNRSSSKSNTVEITVNKVAPLVSSLTSPLADGTYGFGQAIPISVAFSKAVFVAGAPRIALNTSPTRHAIYSSGHGTATLTFIYQPSIGDAVADLGNQSGGIILDGGSIRDRFGNDAVLTLPVAGGPGSLGANKNIAINAAIQAAAPGLGGTSQPVSTGSITIKFNAPVTGVTLNSLSLGYSSNTTTPAYRSVSLRGATLTGSGDTYTLTLPATATSLRGLYRLRIGGVGSTIQAGGVLMNQVSDIIWTRI